jgi:hypothetical protein
VTTESKADGAEEVAVFSIIKPSQCSECGDALAKGEFLKVGDSKPLCLKCADLDHLVFLPSGNVALTRRSRKYSTLSAIVLRFSRSRGRYERQGLLVEEDALERAENESLGDEEKRRLARERAAVVRERADEKYIAEFEKEIAARYPCCPLEEAKSIASHACSKYSGRVGRSAAAKDFDANAIDLAVRAHVRHCHTDYDDLLARGTDRSSARHKVLDTVESVLRRWRG